MKQNNSATYYIKSRQCISGMFFGAIFSVFFLFSSGLASAANEKSFFDNLKENFDNLKENVLTEDNINKFSVLVEEALDQVSDLHYDINIDHKGYKESRNKAPIKVSSEQELHHACVVASLLASNTAVEYLDKLVSRDLEGYNRHKNYLLEKGWIQLPTSEELEITNAGYFGTAFYKIDIDEGGQKKATVLVAHRGTCFDKLNNIITDFEIIERKAPLILEPSFYYLNELLKNNFYSKAEYNEVVSIDGVPVSNIIHAGFSLGGFIASVNALTSNFPETQAVTFDAPGSDYLTDMEKDQLRVINYVTTPNLINTCNAHLGKVRQIIGFSDLNRAQKLNKEIVKDSDSGYSMDLFFLQELFLLLESHNLEKLVSMFDQDCEVKYKDVKMWPTALIDPIYGSEPKRPEFKPLSFDSFKSTLDSVLGIGTSVAKMYAAAMWWNTTKRLNKDAGEYEGVIGFNYERSDDILYSETK